MDDADEPSDGDYDDEYDYNDNDVPRGEGLVNVLSGSVDDPKPLPAVAETLEIFQSPDGDTLLPHPTL